MFGKLKTKSDFFPGKMLLCDMPFSSIFLLNNHERSGSWPNMSFVVVGTHTKCVINEFALYARIDILIFQCHTVTNGIDLRRSPQGEDRRVIQQGCALCIVSNRDVPCALCIIHCALWGEELNALCTGTGTTYLSPKNFLSDI